MVNKYSQTNEESYLMDIFNVIGFTNKFLVDIGAGDGVWLSNSKRFLEEFGFTGTLIDGDNRGNENVKQEWITKDNICDILNKYDCPKEFDLLSYDTDGNDYYILDGLLKEFSPRLVICEFNGTIPNGVSKTIEYNPNHTWGNDDYYGFSFEAGKKLAEKHGYKVVFQNDALNMYLVKNELWTNEVNVTYIPNQYHKHNSTGKWITI